MVSRMTDAVGRMTDAVTRVACIGMNGCCVLIVLHSHRSLLLSLDVSCLDLS